MHVIKAGAFLALALSFAPALRAQDQPSPRARFDAITAEYKKAMADFGEAYGKAKTDEERNALFESKYPKPEQYAPRLRAIADEAPKDPVAVECLVWVLENARTADEATFKALLQHLDSDQLGKACSALQYNQAPGAEPFLRTVLAKSPHQSVQGQACYTLAKVVGGHAGFARQLQTSADKERLESLEQYLGKETAQKLRATDPAMLEKESEQLLEQVAAKFADVKTRRGTLGDAAKGDLFELRNLAVGKVAPEIEGEDVDGVKFKLSDYRGQIVFLDFWGFW